VMAKATSSATGRCYGVARVCQVWEVPRSSFYAAQQAGAAEAGTVVNFVFGAVRCH
jgi:putative transposase